jgi:hypothetical protein
MMDKRKQQREIKQHSLFTNMRVKQEESANDEELTSDFNWRDIQKVTQKPKC